MNNIIKDNWNIIEEKVIKPMYEDGSFPLTVADEITKALQKQISKKPIRVSNNRTDGCPKCKTEYYEKFKYCPECGIKLDWRNYNECARDYKTT